MNRRLFPRSGPPKGVQTLELLLVTPIIVIALIAIMEFGTLHIVQSAVTNAANEGARLAGQGANIDDVVDAVQDVVSLHNITLSNAVNAGTDVVLERGSLPADHYNSSPGFTCATPTPATVDPNEVRVTVCLELDNTPVINVLSSFGFPFPKDRFQIGAVAKKQYALFSDNYNRANSNILDASPDGKSGLLAPLTYAEPRDAAVVVPGLTRITAGELYLGDNSVGTDVSHTIVNQDFALPEIVDQGGFTVACRVEEIAGAAATDSYWAGFGVGMSSAAVTAPGANYVQQNARFFLALTEAGNLQLFQSGLLVASIPAGTAPRRIAARFATASFAGGSPVSVQLFDNGTLVGTINSTWSTGQNYIGFDANEGARVDNLLIEANRN